MKNFDYKQLDDIIHSRVRLTIMSYLIGINEAEFNLLKKKVNATDGNLSANLKKLEQAEYIIVQKEFINRKPVSTYKLSSKGKEAFEIYIKKLEELIK